MTLLKNYETFCPMGLEVVLTDELADPDQLGQRTIVNGQVRQDGSMADCWYTVAEIITWLSTLMPLHAGDLISTGTPPGIERMHPGDEVVCEMARIGRLANPVVAGWGAVTRAGSPISIGEHPGSRPGRRRERHAQPASRHEAAAAMLIGRASGRRR